jgi:benzoyl-CoA reductase subunit A
MKCVVGIDLGSTTTKAVLLDEQGEIVGRGITNSRASYDVACAVAREEALTAARFTLLERLLNGAGPRRTRREEERDVRGLLQEAFRLELYLDQLGQLRAEILFSLGTQGEWREVLEPAVIEILDAAERQAPALFTGEAERKSDFFRDLAGAAFIEGAEEVAERGEIPFERLVALYDRAILNVETRLEPRSFEDLLSRAAARVRQSHGRSAATGRPGLDEELTRVVDAVVDEPIEELAFVGTGYGRQTLPFPKEAIRSEILCHGRGAHRFFPETRTVLDIGGQDTKAIQVDENGVVTSFQMNDRCAAGCGRYLGYLADELNLGLHELGPLALQATRQVRVNSTCTVFAGAELRERLALGERRADILAGLHRAMMLRAMSLLARSGGVHDEFTFTGGVCKNPMATRILGDLVEENYDEEITMNVHPDSIYMGAMGAALFALDDLRAGRPGILPTFVLAETASGAPEPQTAMGGAA